MTKTFQFEVTRVEQSKRGERVSFNQLNPDEALVPTFFLSAPSSIGLKPGDVVELRLANSGQ